MMFALKLQISLMRFFWRIKSAFTNAFAIHHDLRPPFSLVSADTKKPHFVSLSGGSHILQIAKSSDLPQIGKRIVQFVPVNVVNVVIRHIPRYIKPRQSMRQSFDIVDGNRNVPFAVNRTRNFPNKIRAAMISTPSKNAGLRVVIQRFAQMVNGNSALFCHDNQFTIRAA